MLSQIEFKLSLEKQYKDGIEKMARLYQLEGDRKSRQDAESKRIESAQKIQLLQQALKRYSDLHVDIDDGDAADDESINAPNMRKPLSGHLSFRVMQVRDVDHAAVGKFSRGPETFVIVKVEDVVKIKTRTTRIDRWETENHEVEVDKANELELTVYDKPSDHPIPIGMLWPAGSQHRTWTTVAGRRRDRRSRVRTACHRRRSTRRRLGSTAITSSANSRILCNRCSQMLGQ
jgi:Hr1 repeat/C2 domain